MADDFKIVGNKNQAPENKVQDNQEKQDNQGGKVINEEDYNIRAPREKGPTAMGRGGDPFFRRITATREQLLELIDETQTVQDWVQRESCNNAALNCLEEAGLKEVYFAMKDGFDNNGKTYGKISLMGFKTPLGVEIPRLKIYDANGEVIEVLSGPFAMDELNKRALAYKSKTNLYEEVPLEGNAPIEEGIISDYSGNPNDYVT